MTEPAEMGEDMATRDFIADCSTACLQVYMGGAPRELGIEFVVMVTYARSGPNLTVVPVCCGHDPRLFPTIAKTMRQLADALDRGEVEIAWPAGVAEA